MANIIKNFLDSLHLSDDDDDDDDEAYADYVDRANSRERRQTERKEKKERESVRPVRTYSNEDEESEGNQRSNVSPIAETKRERERSQKAERVSKVVPFRSSTNGLIGINVMKPISVEDSQDICDVLLSGSAAIINLEGFDAGQAQRVMDFVSGAVYAVQGKLLPISDYIFIISPGNVDISGDYQDILKQNGFEVPIINRD